MANPPRAGSRTHTPPAPYLELRRRRSTLRVLLAVLLVTAGVCGGIAIFRNDDSTPLPPPFTIPALTPAPRSAIPTTAQIPANEDARLAHISSITDVPLRALRAYAAAEVETRSADPGCHLNWATIAGIGRAESQHGNHGGSSVGADGVATPPVIGLALDGSPGLRQITDTDGGRLDGDPILDHAVGPMQFLPQTWRRWGVRAAGDGAAPDPQNIDDATLTAARYLCVKGGDLATPDGWWTAVLTYNNSVDYAREVFSNADAYARASLKP